MWEEHNVGGDKKKCWERIQWICCVDNDYNQLFLNAIKYFSCACNYNC